MEITKEPDTIYHADREYVSKGWLDKIATCPAKLKYYLDNPDASNGTTPALEFGKMFHHLVLERDTFDQFYVTDEPLKLLNLRTKDGKQAKADFQAENEGKVIITEEDFRVAEEMYSVIYSNRVASALLSQGRPEMTVRWKDGQGCKCKARADWLRDNGVIVDLKTTADASPREFAKSVANFRYDVQDAHYKKGFGVENFVFLAIEKKPPYLVAIYELDDQAKQRGSMLRERDINRYLHCLEKDEWPGFSETIESLSLPNWSLNV